MIIEDPYRKNLSCTTRLRKSQIGQLGESDYIKCIKSSAKDYSNRFVYQQQKISYTNSFITLTQIAINETIHEQDCMCSGCLPAGGGGGAMGTFPNGNGGAAGIAPGWDCGVVSVKDVRLCGNDNFRFGLAMSIRQCGHENFCTLGALSSLVESSRFSSSVARWTSVSAVSQMMSLIASFGSMLNKCCKIFRNGISCGVSATCDKQGVVVIIFQRKSKPQPTLTCRNIA